MYSCSSSPKTKTEAVCRQHPEGRKQNLPSVCLKITSKDELVPDQCLLKWCRQPVRRGADRVRRLHTLPVWCVALLSQSVRTFVSLPTPTKEMAGRGTCLVISMTHTTQNICFESAFPLASGELGRGFIFCPSFSAGEPYRIRGQIP